MIRMGMKWAHGGAARGISDPMNMHFIANRLRRYFAPASTLQAPLSGRTATGNRNTAISAAISSNNAPDDCGIAQLIGGVAQINFKTQFGNQPIVNVHPIGEPPSAGTTLYSAALGFRSGGGPANGAVIQSTDNTDARYIFWHAVETQD